MMKFLKNKIFADPWFESEKIEINYINIDELNGIQHNQLSSRVERWTNEGSGWANYSVMQYKPTCYFRSCSL